MNTSAPKPLDEIARIGARRTALLKELAEVEDQLREAVTYGDSIGIPRTRIAKAAGIAQMTLRRWFSDEAAKKTGGG